MNNILVVEEYPKSFSITNGDHKKVNPKIKIKVYNRNYYLFRKNCYKEKNLDYYQKNKLQIKLTQDAKKSKLPSYYNVIKGNVLVDFK